MFSDEDFARNRLLGPRAFLDSFKATVSLVKVECPPQLKTWFDSFQVIPSFIIFRRMGRCGYYRTTGCQELIPTPKLPGVPKAILHVAVGSYDFAVDILSEEELDDLPYHRFYPAFCYFGQAHEKKSLPKGNEIHVIDGKQYFRLFHHTTKLCRNLILRDKRLNASKWNFCGTRELTETHCYLTDTPKVVSQLDTLPLLMRGSPALDVVYRTDDQARIVKSGVQIKDRKLETRLGFLVDPGLIQPNPMVFHHPIDGQPKWLEIEFPYIYRIPCSGILLKKSVSISGQKHWIVNIDSVQDFRSTGNVLWANGNDVVSLLKLINETFP